jgi:hypothetical protein
MGEKLHKFRSMGEKVAHNVRAVINKVGGRLLSAAAPVAAFNPSLGAGLASAGAIATGTAGIACGVEGALTTGRKRARGHGARDLRATKGAATVADREDRLIVSF